MRFDLRGGGVKIDQALHDSVELRLRFVLGRFGFRVRRATVTLAEGRRGAADGIETHCRMMVQLAASGTVRVEVADADVESALRRALHRIGPAVDREIVRAREAGGRTR